MAETGMAHLGHRDDEGRNRRYWPIPPQGFFYRVDGPDLVVLEIRDARRRRRPW
jgi:hypothetical protein